MLPTYPPSVQNFWALLLEAGLAFVPGASMSEGAYPVMYVKGLKAQACIVAQDAPEAECIATAVKELLLRAAELYVQPASNQVAQKAKFPSTLTSLNEPELDVVDELVLPSERGLMCAICLVRAQSMHTCRTQ